MEHLTNILTNQKFFYQSHETRTMKARLLVLKKLKQEITAHESNILQALKNDFKKPPFEAYVSEYGMVISELNLAIKYLKKWSRPKRVKSSLLTFPSKDYIYKVPYGNVLIISPWNYPFLLAMEPFIMAIAAGNTVVLKPSEQSSHTSKIITNIIKAVFKSEWAVSIEGGVSVSKALLDQKWDYIFFTGSTQIGKIIAKAAARHLTPITLELGGKSPCIVDDTVDLELTAKRLVWGKFFNAGQTCIAPDYIIVKKNIKTPFVEALKKAIIKLYGPNAQESDDFPRIINTFHTMRLSGLLANQHILFGGHIDERNHYIAPTLIDAPDLKSPLMSEEIFGPILPILTYDTVQDIKTIVSNSDHPLAFYTFSKDKTFTELLLKTFHFGGGVINDVLVHFSNNRLPFGGIGTSGMGRYHGSYGFDTFSHFKSIMNRGTWIDIPLRYPPYRNKLSLLKNIFKILKKIS